MKSAIEQIRERQLSRAEQVLGMLADTDAVDVRLWAKDQFEVGFEAGRIAGSRETSREAARYGAGIGLGVGSFFGILLLAPFGWWLWPWPWSMPPAPSCDAVVAAQKRECASDIDEAVRKVTSGGTAVQIFWNTTDVRNMTNRAPVDYSETKGLSCVRETRSGSFLCVPAIPDRTELPVVPVEPVEVP